MALTFNRFTIMAFWFSFLCLLFVHSIGAQTSPELLWDDVTAGRSGDSTQFKPTLHSFPVVGGNANGAAVLICPGGAYYDLAFNHEGVEVARKFNSYGVSAFVVKYRRAPGFTYPIPFDDVRRAMRMIRARSRSLNIDTNRIGIMGFSAGGHLASTIAVHYDTGNKLAQDTIDRLSCRPAFAILVYPVISMKNEFTHAWSKSNLLGDNPDTNLVKFLSNELQVTNATPPTFLIHTKEDNVVQFVNSQLFYDASVSKMPKSKFMQFEKGPHGFGLADGVKGAPYLPELAVWPDTCAQWLDRNGFFKPLVTSLGATRGTGSKSNSTGFYNGRIFVGSRWFGNGEGYDLIGRTAK